MPEPPALETCAVSPSPPLQLQALLLLPCPCPLGLRHSQSSPFINLPGSSVLATPLSRIKPTRTREKGREKPGSRARGLRGNSHDSGQQVTGSKMTLKGQDIADAEAAGMGSRDLCISGHPGRQALSSLAAIPSPKRRDSEHPT